MRGDDSPSLSQVRDVDWQDAMYCRCTTAALRCLWNVAIRRRDDNFCYFAATSFPRSLILHSPQLGFGFA